jgi:NAD-dependent deacetylase
VAGQVGERGAAGRLAELIGSSSSVVALTGAGISVPSGIPDFRSPRTGLWAKVDPMKVAHIDAFHRDTAAFWEYYRPRFQMLGDRRPNPAHRALAELERRGLLDGVVTQNIDRLHGAAGSQRVVEVHGSIATSTCTTCGASYALERVAELFDEDGIATCGGCMGKVKPDVVLFGEYLPEAALADAQQLCAGADLLLCVGSSLEVYPVAGLPELTLGAGGRIAIVTRSETPYDDRADVRLGGDVVAELEAVLAALERPAPTSGRPLWPSTPAARSSTP